MSSAADARRPTFGIGTLMLVPPNLALAALVWAVAVADVDRITDTLAPPVAIDPSAVGVPPVAVLPSSGTQVPTRPDRSNAAALDQTLSRPLFTPGRRPVTQPPTASEVAVAPAVVSAPSVPPKLRLVGVATLPDGGRRVLMRRSGETAGTWYAAGEEIDGWQLAVVGRSEIALTLGPERIVLGLTKPEPEDKTGRP